MATILPPPPPPVLEGEEVRRPLGLDEEAARIYRRHLADIRPIYYSYPDKAPRRAKLKALARALDYLYGEAISSPAASQALGKLALAGALWSRVRPLVRAQADFRLAEQARWAVVGLLDVARSRWTELDRAMEAIKALYDSEPDSIPYPPALRKARTTAPAAEGQA